MIDRAWRRLAASRRLRAAAAVFLVVPLVLAGCSGSNGSDASDSSSSSTVVAPGPASAAAALEAGRTVIDVRTPEEFDAGHVEGARSLDVQDPGFDSALDALDPDGAYVVYCRTGRRSAAAAERMRAVGLDVIDGGSLDDMTSSGWPPSA